MNRTGDQFDLRETLGQEDVGQVEVWFSVVNGEGIDDFWELEA